MTDGKQARPELGAFLGARRAQLRPADVGLPGGTSGRRRTPGLRREEVAQLSGVGVTWYTWLEQGRPISASGQVIDAIGRALQLTSDEHEQLRVLAELYQLRLAERPDITLVLQVPAGEADLRRVTALLASAGAAAR